MLSINTLSGWQPDSEASTRFRSAVERIASTRRIVNPRDDAARLSAAEQLAGHLLSQTARRRQTDDGPRLDDNAEVALSQAARNLQRMRELALNDRAAPQVQPLEQALRAMDDLQASLGSVQSRLTDMATRLVHRQATAGTERLRRTDTEFAVEAQTLRSAQLRHYAAVNLMTQARQTHRNALLAVA